MFFFIISPNFILNDIIYGLLKLPNNAFPTLDIYTPITKYLTATLFEVFKLKFTRVVTADTGFGFGSLGVAIDVYIADVKGVIKVSVEFPEKDAVSPIVNLIPHGVMNVYWVPPCLAPDVIGRLVNWETKLAMQNFND